MTILGISLLPILLVVVFAFGVYGLAKIAIANHYELKREKASAKRDSERVHAALDYAENAHRHLTDPDLQAATAKEIAGKIKTALKGVKLADQFETVDTTGPAQS